MEFKKDENSFYQENEDGERIAEITYKPVGDSDEVVDADHTFVDPSLRGQGIAEQLVERLVEEMEKEGKKISPSCPYVVELFKRKPDKYGHIMADEN
jgi:hypothetical protein